MIKKLFKGYWSRSPEGLATSIIQEKGVQRDEAEKIVREWRDKGLIKETETKDDHYILIKEK